MKKRYLFITALIMAALLLPAYATTMTTVDYVCPVCGTKLKASEIMSTNNFGGQDKDFFIRAAGAQPIRIYPITCTHCMYSGYGEDFKEGVKVSEKLKKALKNHEVKALVKIKDDGNSNDVPAWARYDLVGKCYIIAEEKPENVAGVYLKASWVVRLDARPQDYFSQDKKKAVFESFKEFFTEKKQEEIKGIENRAMQDIVVADKLFEGAKTAEGDKKEHYLIMALSLYREHGENPKVIEILGILEPLMKKEEFAGFKKQVMESINLERSFQEKALANFKKVLELKPEEKQMAIFTYLCGELNRRLGNNEEALKDYNKSVTYEKAPDFIKAFAKEQKELISPQMPEEGVN